MDPDRGLGLSGLAFQRSTSSNTQNRTFQKREPDVFNDIDVRL